MLPTPQPTGPVPAEDPDLRRVLSTLRRGALPILASAVLAGGASYLIAAREPTVYEATSSLVALRNDDGNGLLRDSVFSAPPLPRGALQEALQNREVLENVLVAVRASGLPIPAQRELGGEVRAQLAGGTPPALSVESRSSSPQDGGVYEVRGRASSPQAARVLADAGASALLGWDDERAGRRLAELRSRLERQFAVLDARLSANPASETRREQLERQTLAPARTQVLRNLAQITALEQSTSGTLDRLAGVPSPARVLSPHPLRMALLAGLLALLLSSGALLLLDRARRRVYDERDLQGWGVPLLGRLPTLRGVGPVAAAAGPWRDPVGFLRVNVLSQLDPSLPGGPLGGERPCSVVVASPRGAEGRSSVTAALAASLAAGGERVLIVDADTRDGAQSRLWGVGPDGSPTGGVTLCEGVDLLPAAALRRESGGLDLARLDGWLEGRVHRYDTVLFDTPPLLTSPDAVTLAARAGGLVLIVVPGVTGRGDLEAAFAAAHTARARVLGLLLNARPPLSGAGARPARSEDLARDLRTGEAAVR